MFWLVQYLSEDHPVLPEPCSIWSNIEHCASFFTSYVLGYILPFKHHLIHSLFVKFHVVKVPMSSGVIGKGIAW